MSSYRRNVAVGATVLGAMVILGWMILQFGGRLAEPFTPKQFPVRAVGDRADGLSDGSPVVYRGVTVGRVIKVSRHPSDMTVVHIDALIDLAPPLPANVEARIVTQGLIGGGASLVLVTVPDSAPPQGTLSPGQQIKTSYVGLTLLPPEFGQLASVLTETARDFRRTGILDNLNQQITKAGKVLDSAETLLNDPALRDDLAKSLANLREITDSAKRIGGNLEKFTGTLDKLGADTAAAVNEARGTIAKTEGHLDTLASQLNDRVAQTAVLLDKFQSIAGKIDRGQGTAGQLVNDPRLYESLVATAQELNLTIRDLKRLVEQWEQEGVSLKLR